MPDVDEPMTERKAAAQRRAEHVDEQQRPQVAARSGSGTTFSDRVVPFPATELRAQLVDYNGQQRYHLEGHASVVDVRYEMWDMFGPYEEIIDRGAFDDTLAAGPDVAFLVNHRGVTMARTTNKSLKLSMDDVGLHVEAWLNPKRQDVSDLVTAVDDGDITEMSFAFMLEEGWWSDDFETFKITKTDIDRGDVSAVNYGANPYTDIAARAQQVLADVEHMPPTLGREAVQRLLKRDDLDIDDLFKRAELVRQYDETRAAVEALPDEPKTPQGRSLTTVEALLED